jgi:hypothetical protein
MKKYLPLLTSLLVALFLATAPIMAQIPRDVPKGTGPLKLETPFDYILYVGMPILIIILFFIWWSRRKKREEEE